MKLKKLKEELKIIELEMKRIDEEITKNSDELGDDDEFEELCNEQDNIIDKYNEIIQKINIEQNQNPDKIKRGNLYFKMGNGNVKNSKYFITDGNENKDNGFKEGSFGVLEIKTKQGNLLKIICYPEDIVIFSEDNKILESIELKALINKLNIL